MMRACATLSKSRSLLTEACTITRSSSLMSRTMSDRCLHRDASLRPFGSRVFSNVGVARHTVSNFLHFDWTKVLQDGNTGEIILRTRAQ